MAVDHVQYERQGSVYGFFGCRHGNEVKDEICHLFTDVVKYKSFFILCDLCETVPNIAKAGASRCMVEFSSIHEIYYMYHSATN